ncbi:hypothetical protein BV25DRAFT_1912907 [Artomyces pyxidatus]|uniref:Uncharacterized protein n=1 Tax=Artomyces pyxidatus TaxID=48021 RepID=A0ACB8TDA9_9AGAM|nr:hypothetical protein BV25DRAFT_1912907 [Artomyces pyxidatus]
MSRSTKSPPPKKRHKSSSSSTISSYSTTKTPRDAYMHLPTASSSSTLGKAFSVIKMKTDHNQTVPHRRNSELTGNPDAPVGDEGQSVPQAAVPQSLPEWMNNALSTLKRDHPIRRLMPMLRSPPRNTPLQTSVETYHGPRLPAPQDERPASSVFAFQPPPALAMEPDVPPVDDGSPAIWAGVSELDPNTPLGGVFLESPYLAAITPVLHDTARMTLDSPFTYDPLLSRSRPLPLKRQPSPLPRLATSVNPFSTPGPAIPLLPKLNNSMNPLSALASTSELTLVNVGHDKLSDKSHPDSLDHHFPAPFSTPGPGSYFSPALSARSMKPMPTRSGPLALSDIKRNSELLFTTVPDNVDSSLKPFSTPGPASSISLSESIHSRPRESVHLAVPAPLDDNHGEPALTLAGTVDLGALEPSVQQPLRRIKSVRFDTDTIPPETWNLFAKPGPLLGLRSPRRNVPAPASNEYPPAVTEEIKRRRLTPPLPHYVDAEEEEEILRYLNSPAPSPMPPADNSDEDVFRFMKAEEPLHDPASQESAVFFQPQPHQPLDPSYASPGPEIDTSAIDYLPQAWNPYTEAPDQLAHTQTVPRTPVMSQPYAFAQLFPQYHQQGRLSSPSPPPAPDVNPFETPGQAYHASVPVYFDSPTEDPSSSPLPPSPSPHGPVHPKPSADDARAPSSRRAGAGAGHGRVSGNAAEQAEEHNNVASPAGTPSDGDGGWADIVRRVESLPRTGGVQLVEVQGEDEDEKGAFAPAPGVFVSPLKGDRRRKEEQEISSWEDEHQAVVEGIEDIDPASHDERPASRGSEHDSIESWTQ